MDEREEIIVSTHYLSKTNMLVDQLNNYLAIGFGFLNQFYYWDGWRREKGSAEWSSCMLDGRSDDDTLGITGEGLSSIADKELVEHNTMVELVVG